MKAEDDQLRRALEARSGVPSPEFRARLTQALSVRPRGANLTPVIAFATVIVLSMTSVGVLVASRHLGRTAGTAASGARTTTSPPPLTDVTSVQLSAPSATVVWALVNSARLYRSTDQGTHWEQRPSQLGRSIAFIDDHEGWLLSPGSAATQCQQQLADVWHTTDAGASWQKLPTTGIGVSQCKGSIWFVDTKHGFVAAWDPNHQPTVYRTSDGGSTWSATTLQDPAYFKSKAGGFTLQVDWITRFGGTLYLEASGSQDDPNLPHDNQFVLRSADGGASWSYVTKVPSRAVVMVTEERWLDYTAPGQPMESVNGGQQFHQYTSDFNLVTTQLLFADADVGYAVGPGTVQVTVNGGAHWASLATPWAWTAAPSPVSTSPIPMPTSAQISAPSVNVVWALVADQYLFRSTDQGTTWHQRSLPTSSPFTDISFVDDQNGWLLMGGPAGTQCSFGPATLWRTTDGGNSWTMVSSVDLPPASGPRTAGSIGSEQCKENLYFVDSNRGFLDAWDPNSAPTVYRTVDGGITWASSKLPDPLGFKTIGAGDALRADRVTAFGGTLLLSAGGMQPDGMHSYVFQSTDGGVTWRALTGVPSVGTESPVMISSTRWVFIGNDGIGQETTDAGKSWHAFSCDYQDAAGVPSTFVFASDKVGYGTVRGGIHRTVDGGAHWELIKTSWP